MKGNTKKFTEEDQYTGNVCVDMISNAVSHYKNSIKTIKTIKLRSDYYDLLIEYIRHDTDVKIGTKLKWGNIDIEVWDQDTPTPMDIIFE